VPELPPLFLYPPARPPVAGRGPALPRSWALFPEPHACLVPRLEPSGSYPELGWGRAATTRGMRGIRWTGDPHAEAAPPPFS
jgi:hypothetical protein